MEVSEFALQQSDILLGAFNSVTWPMHLPSHHLMHVYDIHGEYSVITLYSKHHKSAQHT